MNLEKIKKIIKEKVKLPDWVRDWSVTEDLDSDNEPMLRVWFDVDWTIDLDAGKEPKWRVIKFGANRDLDQKAVFDETMAVQDEIRRVLRDEGIDEWLVVILDSPIPK